MIQGPGIVVCIVLAAAPGASESSRGDAAVAERPTDELAVTAPPTDWKLSPFYSKHVSAGGFPVVGSAQVADHALLEAAYLINCMLADRPDVRAALIENKVRFAVMACDERTCDVPEHSDLKPAVYWNKRARGLGATHVRPAVSCGEENLLGYPGDPYASENILVHEFAHAMHQMGLNHIDPAFDERLEAVFDSAMKQGLWKGKYAATNHYEYWAEGVQSWFGTNRQDDHDHNHVNTRGELEEYDPELAALIAEVFRNSHWRYRRPGDREETPHLEGYDRRAAPTFRWEPELSAAYEKYQAEQRSKRRESQ